MKTLIVGAGALGGIIGARLLAAGASVYRGHFRETVYVETVYVETVYV
jgi:ketopantoate reductase